ncbi:patatin-like phospholipase family protein [Vibrio superstes]|uniref:Patatin family protein n=1 Tax=Vibrio superstes NBRC 103154 TaxID=1219062 RepID=A0A511QLW1_9VIBR|nr:patatin family protein [Vibrio superstes]GEM77976.1 patatin family protein [Vibrio superstes NBRC 103154]
MSNKALVVEGGAMRGIFAAGVLDAFLEQQHRPFDFALGVSAGASNMLGYLTGAKGRSYRVISELATSRKFFNPGRFIRGGNLMDVKWLSETSMQRYPLDLKKLFEAMPFYAATTNINTGLADYFKVSQDNLADVMEATTALPIAYKRTPCFSGGCYADGGVADSIPVKEAYRRGARDITVILSEPLSYEMRKLKNPRLIKLLLKENSTIAEALQTRAERYNESLAFIRNPPSDAKIRVIAPPEDFPVKRLTRKKKLLDIGYTMGLKAGQDHVLNLKGIEHLSPEECSSCYA